MVALTVLDGLILLQERLVRNKAQCLGRYGEDIVLLERIDGHVGRQSRLQLQVVVGSRDHHLVGHHVTLGRSLLAHLRHGTLEMVIGEGVHREAHALTLHHATDVGLVDISNHTHVCQVLRNHEQLRRIERGSHRLTFLDGLRQDHTVDG